MGCLWVVRKKLYNQLALAGVSGGATLRLRLVLSGGANLFFLDNNGPDGGELS